MPTQEQVLEALKKVRFPGLSRDIVSFGFVRDIRIEGSNVSFTIHFQTENPNVGQRLSRRGHDRGKETKGGKRQADDVIDCRKDKIHGNNTHRSAGNLKDLGYKRPVVSHQGDVRRFDRHVRTERSHGNSDIRLGEGWGVIHPVANHHHDLFPSLVVFDHTDLLFGQEV